MKQTDIQALGFPAGPISEAAFKWAISQYKVGKKRPEIEQLLTDLLLDPDSFYEGSDPELSKLADLYLDFEGPFVEREEPAPWKQWGEDLEDLALDQMRNAVRLPVAVAGALMPDAHMGYGLPIGGVLACDNAVIPYAVGVDIACRVKMTVLPISEESIKNPYHMNTVLEDLTRAIEKETRFGMGASFEGSDRRVHAVLDDPTWEDTSLLRSQKDKAWNQLGSSGGGNHFVDVGTVEIFQNSGLGIWPGTYIAIFSHSGSRGPGSHVANHYSKIAQELHPELPEELRHLAWLSLDSEVGQEYWNAMELMGRYASANHWCIHEYICNFMGMKPLLQIENHHNFAWKEQFQGREVVVHRKGATPAGKDDLGIIPGSMADPAYIVRGLGSEDSINSASHGAGRKMSRKKAQQNFNWDDVNRMLEQRGVHLISGGLDEVPGAYKDIREVMANQTDLVTPIGRFDPKLVKMAPHEPAPWMVD